MSNARFGVLSETSMLQLLYQSCKTHFNGSFGTASHLLYDLPPTLVSSSIYSLAPSPLVGQILSDADFFLPMDFINNMIFPLPLMFYCTLEFDTYPN